MAGSPKTVFSAVRFKVKPGLEQTFLGAHGDVASAWPGLRLLFTSTTGDHALYCVLDEALRPVPAEMPAAVRTVVDRIGENCEPSLCSVIFMAGSWADYGRRYAPAY